MNPTMPESDVDALEAQCKQLAVAVAVGDVEALPPLSEQLQQLAVNLSEAWQRQGPGNGMTSVRLQAVADGLQGVRVHLLRRAMLVEQALNLVVPASVAPTYAGNRAYGTGVRASGRLPAVVA